MCAPLGPAYRVGALGGSGSRRRCLVVLGEAVLRLFEFGDRRRRSKTVVAAGAVLGDVERERHLRGVY